MSLVFQTWIQARQGWPSPPPNKIEKIICTRDIADKKININWWWLYEDWWGEETMAILSE